jgi:hypothetical protein
MKVTGKPGTGKPYAGFDEAGAGNGLIPGTAPALDPTEEKVLEIGYGREAVTLPEETGRNGEYKRRPLATTPVLYSRGISSYLFSSDCFSYPLFCWPIPYPFPSGPNRLPVIIPKHARHSPPICLVEIGPGP